MILHIFLDSHPLSALAHPMPDPNITKWALACDAAGHQIIIPEVIDYELRRELLRVKKYVGVSNLDILKATSRFLPITSDAMLLAADLWATSRQSGFSTGDPKKLDIDVILAAQALTLGISKDSLVIATSNVSHIVRFVPADEWQNVVP